MVFHSSLDMLGLLRTFFSPRFMQYQTQYSIKRGYRKINQERNETDWKYRYIYADWFCVCLNVSIDRFVTEISYLLKNPVCLSNIIWEIALREWELENVCIRYRIFTPTPAIIRHASIVRYYLLKISHWKRTVYRKDLQQRVSLSLSFFPSMQYDTEIRLLIHVHVIW